MEKKVVGSQEEFEKWLEEQESDGSGTGGYVGQIVFAVGYNSYASGMKPADRWFPYRYGDEASKGEAKKEASALGANIEVCYGLILRKDTVLNKDVSHWQGDRYFVVPTWQDAGKQVIKPALSECGIFGSPVTFWGRVSFKPDPYDPGTDDDPNLVAYPAQVFESREAAQKFVDENMGSAGGDEPIPGMEGPPSWLVEYVGKPAHKDKSPADLSNEVGIEIPVVIEARKQAGLQ